MVYLIVGLGNPGEKYSLTRHNVGFRVVDRFSHQYGLTWRNSSHLSWAKGKVKGKQVYLLKPLTYMNQSGEGLLHFPRFHLFCEGTLIVVHDEMDFPPGVVRIKKGGGSAGHRGLDSVIETLKRDDFLRIRVGIGKPLSREKAIDYVLGIPEGEEKILLDEGEEKAVSALSSILEEGWERTMSRYNARES
ncbi:MAG TPA: aminoacyl-tRNA hydrolase [Candidatus Atribacteria bacterium]|nr:aminoacyl-tRNA hydrolase [Candidatus Atribacteria bacterium]